MKYILTIGALGKFPEIDINSNQFLRLKSSRAILTEALAVEEKYEIVISNYLDLEKELINVSVLEMVRDCLEYADFFNVRLALNIRLINLLTSVKLYTDTLVSHLSACLPDESGIKERAKKFFSAEYDKNFDYRFMYALRNHVQHSGTAVHRVTTGSKWTDIDDGLLGCDLRLMSVDTDDSLVNEGRNLFIVALVSTNLHIRIFDANGKRVVDKTENQLISGEALTTLKKQLNPLPDESGLSQEQKHKIIRDATSIAGHTRLIEYSLYFSAKKEYLLANDKFKKEVLNEMPDEVNLCSASRSYIESISAIHNQARELIRKSVTEARASIEAAINDYKPVYRDDFVGLHAYKFDGNKKIDEVAVFLDWDDVRLGLEKRNRQLVNLRKMYVTGQSHNK